MGPLTAKDPVRFRSGSGNFYAYGPNDPINSIDPSGLFVWDLVDFLFFLDSAKGLIDCPGVGTFFSALIDGVGLLPILSTGWITRLDDVGDGLRKAGSFFDDVSNIGPTGRYDDVFHNFPNSLTYFEDAGVVAKNADGYTELMIEGSLNGLDGLYEIGKKDGEITHWFFNPDRR